MAKIFPDVEKDFHNSFGEYKIFNALKKLPDEWNIYHSINWQQRDKHGIIRWGEADFLIFNRDYGILVVEAKRKSGTLITTDFALEQGRDVFVIPRKY